MKLIININILVLIINLLMLNTSVAQNKLDTDQIEINVINNINLNKLIRGEYKTATEENQVIIFDIYCTREVQISILNGVENPDVIFESEWKSGPNSGFENDFVNGAIYTPSNNKYRVTLKIKSITVKNNAILGKHFFAPSIKVEYLDI